MNNNTKPYDEQLYALKTQTLRKIADAEGATAKIAQVKATIFSVAGELFYCEREALTVAIEYTRRKKGGTKK